MAKKRITDITVERTALLTTDYIAGDSTSGTNNTGKISFPNLLAQLSGGPTTPTFQVKLSTLATAGLGGVSRLARGFDIFGSNPKATTAAVENLFQVASNDAANPLALRLGVKTDATGGSRYGSIEVDDAGTKRHLALQPTSGFVGINTALPVGNLHVGSGGIETTTEPGIIVSKVLTDSLTSNPHSFVDVTRLTRNGTMVAMASFDASVTLLGAFAYDHYIGFKSRLKYQGSVSLTDAYGVRSDLDTTGASGTITNAYRYYAADDQGAGATIVNNYGLYVGNLNRGTTLNYGVFVSGLTPSFFGGKVGIGIAPLQSLHIKENTAGAGTSLLRLDNGGTVGNQAGMEFWTSPTDSASTLRTGRIYGVWDGGNYTDARLMIQTMAGGNTLVDTIAFKNSNVGIGQTTFGSSAAKVLALGNGTIPGILANAFQMVSADIVAGNAAPHFVTEAGPVIRLYQQAGIADPVGGGTVDAEARTAINGILAALENTRLLAVA